MKAAIVRHIRQQTTKEHHEEVSALINTALEKPYKPAAHRSAHKMWVSRHRKLLKRQTHHEAKWLELSAAMGPANRNPDCHRPLPRESPTPPYALASDPPSSYFPVKK